MDDPRLSSLITEGNKGDIVIVGSPFDDVRKRCINKGGEDNGPDCIRRFYKKVGPLINAEYQIDISSLKVSDYGNIHVQFESKQPNPEKVIMGITECVGELIKNNQIPIVFGGSKQSALGSIQAFYKCYGINELNKVILIAGRPNTKRLYDNDKLTSDNLITKLLADLPQISITLFGPQSRYFPDKDSPTQYRYVSMEEIRKQQVKGKIIGRTTQGLFAFEKLIEKENNFHLSLSVEAIARFAGCRDLTTSGLQIQQMLEIFYLAGQRNQIKSIDISEFNPSCEDYESSLKLLNLVYYFLMGKSSKKQS